MENIRHTPPPPPNQPQQAAPANSNIPPAFTFERLIWKSKKEPLVPIGCAVTVGFLLAGFRAFTGGNQKLSQHLMRGRVVAQGLTLAAIFAGAAMQRDKLKRAEEKVRY
eukprot:12800-Heterococcus_DN1.PRE.2